MQEVISMLRWINESEPMFQFNDANVEKWHYALRNVDAAVAKQAILEYTEKHNTVPKPSEIAMRAKAIRNSRVAGERAMALDPAKPVAHPISWRARNPGDWDRLFERGRAERERDLKRVQGHL